MHIARRPRAVQNHVGQNVRSRHKYGALWHVHPRARTSGTIAAREFMQTNIFSVFSQEAACKVQQNDRLHKWFGSNLVVETLRVFVTVEGGLQSPKYDRLHIVRIHPCCRDLSWFYAFWKLVRKVSKSDRFRKVRIHPRGGDFMCFFACGLVTRMSEIFSSCAMYRHRLRSRDLVWFVTNQKVFGRSGLLWALLSACRTGGSRPPVYTTAVNGRQRERSSKTEHRTNRKKRGGRGGKKSGWGGFVKIVGVLIWRLNGSHISDQNEWCT